MTGHWQIFGSSRIPMREMVKIDYLYGANWSLWLDTKILLRTVPYVAAARRPLEPGSGQLVAQLPQRAIDPALDRRQPVRR